MSVSEANAAAMLRVFQAWEEHLSREMPAEITADLDEHLDDLRERMGRFGVDAFPVEALELFSAYLLDWLTFHASGQEEWSDEQHRLVRSAEVSAIAQLGIVLRTLRLSADTDLRGGTARELEVLFSE